MTTEQEPLPIVCATTRKRIAKMDIQGQSILMWCKQCRDWHNYSFRMLLRTYLDAIELLDGHKHEDVLELPHGREET